MTVIMGEKDIHCIIQLLNDLAKLISGKMKSSRNKIRGRYGFRTLRYCPYEIDIDKSKRRKMIRKESGKKTRMKLNGIDAEQSTIAPTYSKFVFLDDLFTMSTKEVGEIAQNGHGFKLILSDSQDSVKLDEDMGKKSRLTVSKAPGTSWIEYS